MNLLHFDSETSWVKAAASLWRDRLRSNPQLRMCLPSGHTPNKIYEEMGRSVAAGLVSFKHAEIFALDDYGGLALDDPGRCRNMLQRYLLDHIDLPPERFHAIDTEARDLDKVCRDYDFLIESGRGFDLTLLGIGLNGHLGLNEPRSTPETVTRRVQMAESTVNGTASYLTHSNLPTWGVGVGLKQLLASREVWLLACGRAKAEIIRRAAKGPVNASVPASFLQRHANCFTLVDALAGELL